MPKNDRPNRSKKVTPSFALIELEHTRDLVVSNQSHTKKKGQKASN